MQISLCKITLRLPSSHSLKDKRRIIKSISTRIRYRFNVAIAEVQPSDSWQITQLGIVTVSNNKRYSEGIISKILHYMHHNIRSDYEIIDQHQETIRGI